MLVGHSLTAALEHFRRIWIFSASLSDVVIKNTCSTVSIIHLGTPRHTRAIFLCVPVPCIGLSRIGRDGWKLLSTSFPKNANPSPLFF